MNQFLICRLLLLPALQFNGHLLNLFLAAASELGNLSFDLQTGNSQLDTSTARLRTISYVFLERRNLIILKSSIATSAHLFLLLVSQQRPVKVLLVLGCSQKATRILSESCVFCSTRIRLSSLFTNLDLAFGVFDCFFQ